MLNKSIAYRLSIYISLAVISVFIVFIGIYFLFNQRIIEENIENKAITLGAEITGEVNQYVVSLSEISSNIADQVIYYDRQKELDHFISSLIKKYSYINSIHINIDSSQTEVLHRNYYCYRNKDSIIIEKANENFDTCLSEEESINPLLQQNVPGWSEPFRCERTENIVVAIYQPVFSDNDLQDERIGEVFCELSLLELNKRVNKISVGDEGFAFLISSGGSYITHPVEEWILERNIFNLSKDVFDLSKFDFAGEMKERRSGSLIAYPELFDHKKSWVYYTPVSQNGWVLIFAVPFRELYEPLYLPVLQMLFFSVLGILIIYLLVTYITDRQIRPLSSVTQQLKMFSRIAGSSGEDDSQNEIAQVSLSLNNMRRWYEKYKATSRQEAQRRESRERDLLQASEIQQSFIKTDFPAFPDRDDVDVYAMYKPAQGVSGDLFDYFFVDDKNLVLTIGDVSGKGIPAAFFMSVAQTIIKSNSNQKVPKLIVESTNTELYTNNQHQFFLTLFLGVLNVETGELTYCNAAHTASYILKENGEIVDLAQSHGLPLGLYPDKKYAEAKIQLAKGDSIVLYTDGVSELQDENKLQYGNKRLEKNLSSLAGHTPKEIVLRIEKSLHQFIGQTKQSDDISVLILKYNP